MSPDCLIPPSAITGTSAPVERTPSTAFMIAVICGMPTPVTTRVVQIEPGASLTEPDGAAAAGEAAAATIAAAVTEISAERVAIDPPLLAGSPDADAASEFTASLLRATLRETHCTTLISGLRVRGAPGFTRLGIEEQLADGIIDLRVEDDAGRRHRVLAVREMHGTRTNLDDHLFAILAGRGIVVGEA